MKTLDILFPPPLYYVVSCMRKQFMEWKLQNEECFGLINCALDVGSLIFLNVLKGKCDFGREIEGDI